MVLDWQKSEYLFSINITGCTKIEFVVGILSQSVLIHNMTEVDNAMVT